MPVGLPANEQVLASLAGSVWLWHTVISLCSSSMPALLAPGHLTCNATKGYTDMTVYDKTEGIKASTSIYRCTS